MPTVTLPHTPLSSSQPAPVPSPAPAPSYAPAPVAGRTSTGRPRLLSLDVVRGIALAGILFVNVPVFLQLASYFPGEAHDDNIVRTALDLLVQQRFFPIFSLLFGVGFGMMWRSAQRAARPRVVMLRRLVFLLALGVLHTMLQPGEALLIYAIAGIVFALPLTWAPRGVALGLGGFLTLATVAIGGSVFLAAALIMLGFALAQYGIAEAMEHRTTLWRRTALIAWPLGLALTALQYVYRHDMAMSLPVAAAAGLAMSVAYVATVVLLMQTSARDALDAVFAPLGRMALTNYICATLVALTARPFAATLGIEDTTTGFAVMVGWCVALLAAQVLVSRWWLGLRGQGPLEWIWRQVTWLGARG